jgi:hypothetical protein
MSDPKFRYYLEMRAANPRREVTADSYQESGDWLIFYRNPPQGGKDEYWRVRLDAVISMETRRG